MSAATSRFRSAVRDLRPRGHAWWIIAGACIAGVLLFLVLWLGGRTPPAEQMDIATPAPSGSPSAALPAPLPASELGASGIEYPPPPPAPVAPPAPAVVTPPTPAEMPPDAATAVDTTQRAPRAISTPSPNYPRASLRRGEAGEVLLRIHVGADGRPGAIDIVRSSGHRRLDQAAVAAVRRWRFEPALRDGRAVPGEVQVPVAFAPEVR